MESERLLKLYESLDKVNMHNPTLLTLTSLNEISSELAYIFDTTIGHIDCLFRLRRIEFPDIVLFDLFKKKELRFSDIFDRTTLHFYAQAIFSVWGYEDELLRAMHTTFIDEIRKTYGGDVNKYAEGIKDRCVEFYGMADILDYLKDDFATLNDIVRS